MDETDYTWGCLLLLVAFVVWSVWFFGLNPFSNEITSYTALCGRKEVTTSGCKDSAELRSLEKQTYTISKSGQEIVYWNDIFNRYDKMLNCAIVNRENWTCGYSDGVTTLTVQDGDFASAEFRSAGIEYISRWYYYWLNIKMWWRGIKSWLKSSNS